mmetsp:Transcript_15130/g.23487  ORF Transcript_15130/g.23487 Transcript_15130/m.23487 type:complete len:183 (+) Transcript_15130:713-1261(+)|eukprot:CAMPEP_0196815918 /NCGR_PEP_ID=MMETSP1362-20130617/52600_1 /TAXON_ID=163516 /ORGANISM="Leptocylindrus danicus, Strain CCMP1856" /LENGTH=182 /DNA_ID=CAMNT_0042193061 /DNA_START=701 /DNA_END=1249 /DNA_ORIENTATION=+
MRFFEQLRHLTVTSRKQRKHVAKKQRTIDGNDDQEGRSVRSMTCIEDELALLDEDGETNFSPTEGFITAITTNPCHFFHVYTGRLSTLYEEDVREECADDDDISSGCVGTLPNLDQEFIRERWIYMSNMSSASEDSFDKTPLRRKMSLSSSSSSSFSNRSPTGLRGRHLSSNSVFSIEMAEI